MTSLPGLSDIRNNFIDIQFGKMEIINNQMKVWDKSNNLIVTYNLFDNQGHPTMGAVYRKEVV